MSMNNKKESEFNGKRELQIVAFIFILYLFYLLIAGSMPGPGDRFVIDTSMGEVEKAAGDKLNPSVRKQIIRNAAFDSQGFPIKEVSIANPENENQLVTGKSAVLRLLDNRLENAKPEKVLESFTKKYGYYWQNPNSPEFVQSSKDRAKTMEKTAQQNRKLIEAMLAFLQSDAGVEVSSNLQKNLSKAIDSPAREILLQGFSAWKAGNLDQAYILLQKAEAKDPDSPFIQIIAHHGMSVLNMERHGPLEETMRQYRHLAEESHRYISGYRQALEKAGFDPVKLYGRDPFDASRLPSAETLDKAMDQSRYIQFEREYYQKDRKSHPHKLSSMEKSTIKHLKLRQKGKRNE